MSNADSNSPRLPKLGQVIIFHQPNSEKSLGNGATEHPAIITRVWGPDCVNLKVLPDCGIVCDRTSVPRAFHGGSSWGFRE